MRKNLALVPIFKHNFSEQSNSLKKTLKFIIKEEMQIAQYFQYPYIYFLLYKSSDILMYI